MIGKLITVLTEEQVALVKSAMEKEDSEYYALQSCSGRMSAPAEAQHVPGWSQDWPAAGYSETERGDNFCWQTSAGNALVIIHRELWFAGRRHGIPWRFLPEEIIEELKDVSNVEFSFTRRCDLAPLTTETGCSEFESRRYKERLRKEGAK